jgi:MSHA biogenesis protein MshI
MNLQWPMFGPGSHGWTAFDAAADGTFAAASVRTSRYPAGKPQVLQCAQSSGTAMGAHAIEELIAKVGAAGFPCTLALPRGGYQMLVVPEAPVLQSEMEASLRWSLASMVEFPVDEAVVAWMRIPTAEFQPEREKQLYAIVSRQSVIDEQAAYFKNVKPALKAIDVRETALRNIAALLEKKGEGLGLLTVGNTGISTTFTFKGELYLDRFIAQPLEEMLTGDAQRRQKFFDRVAQQVYQSMELITRSHPFISIERMVLGPMPAPLALGEYLAGKLPLPVQNLDLSSIFDLSGVPELSKPVNQARYLVALGAALRGIRTTV